MLKRTLLLLSVCAVVAVAIVVIPTATKEVPAAAEAVPVSMVLGAPPACTCGSAYTCGYYQFVLCCQSMPTDNICCAVCGLDCTNWCDIQAGLCGWPNWLRQKCWDGCYASWLDTPCYGVARADGLLDAKSRWAFDQSVLIHKEKSVR